MNVIFLDIDGVINSDKTFEKQKYNESDLSEEKLKILKHIVNETNAIIVLSSSWKKFWNKDPNLKEKQHIKGHELDKYFSKYGLTIYDKTPDLNHSRGKEIREWLRYHKDVEHWVVLDDEIYNDFESEKILNYLVKTCFYNEGLEDVHIEKIIKILSSSEEDLEEVNISRCNISCKFRGFSVCDGFCDN